MNSCPPPAQQIQEYNRMKMSMLICAKMMKKRSYTLPPASLSPVQPLLQFLRSPGSSGAQEGLCKRRDISDGRRVQQCDDEPRQSHCTQVVCRITSKRFYTHQRCSSLFFISPGGRKIPFFCDFQIFYKTAVLCYCLSSLSSPVSRRGSPY